MALAVFRIAVFSSLVGQLIALKPWTFSQLPYALATPPAAAKPLFNLVHPTATVVKLTVAITVVSAIMALIGLRTKVTAAVCVVASVYSLGVPQLYGKVDHYHHVVWFAGLLALVPASDALSVDARLGRVKESLKTSANYGFPLRVTWVVIGTAYLFAGINKIRTGGFGWIFGDNFRYQLLTQLHVTGWTPPFRLDESAWLYKTAAFGIVLFELSFLCLIFVRRTRPLAVATGIAFHVGTGILTGIWFLSLLVCYVAFLGFTSSLSVAERRTVAEEKTAPIALIGGTLLILAVGVFGAKGVEGAWPVAAYPIFYPLSEPTVTAGVGVFRTAKDEEVEMTRTNTVGRSFDERRYKWLLKSAAESEHKASTFMEFVEQAGRIPSETVSIALYREKRVVGYRTSTVTERVLVAERTVDR